MNRNPDPSRVAAAFHQKAAEYDQHVQVQKRVVANLVGSIATSASGGAKSILDVGTGTGALLEKLHGCFPAAQLTGIDSAPNMCLRAQQKLGTTATIVTGDARCLPFDGARFDLVVSASALQWVPDLSTALHEMRRVLRSGGWLRLAFFCEGTLGELQHCFRDAAGRSSGERGTVTSRLHHFHTLEEVRTIVTDMDFEQCVLGVETEIDWYADMFTLLRSIKNIGAGSVAGGASSGLGWRGILNEASHLYQERYGEPGRIPATYTVLYLTARVRL